MSTLTRMFHLFVHCFHLVTLALYIVGISRCTLPYEDTWHLRRPTILCLRCNSFSYHSHEPHV